MLATPFSFKYETSYRQTQKNYLYGQKGANSLTYDVEHGVLMVI
jgi:hypothetical protein